MKHLLVCSSTITDVSFSHTSVRRSLISIRATQVDGAPTKKGCLRFRASERSFLSCPLIKVQLFVIYYSRQRESWGISRRPRPDVARICSVPVHCTLRRACILRSNASIFSLVRRMKGVFPYGRGRNMVRRKMCRTCRAERTGEPTESAATGRRGWRRLRVGHRRAQPRRPGAPRRWSGIVERSQT